MATPTDTPSSLPTFKGMLDDIVVLKEQQVIAAVGALVAARLEVKTWLALQTAIYNYAPIGPYLGPEEERLVWQPVLGAIRDLGAGGGLGASASLQEGMREMAREVRARFSANVATQDRTEAAADTAASSEVRSQSEAAHDGDRTAPRAAAPSESASGDHGDRAPGPSSLDQHPAVVAGSLPSVIDTPAPPRRGLRGVVALEAAAGVGLRSRVGPPGDADGAGTGGRPNQVGSGAGSAAGGGGGAGAEVDLRSLLTRAARTFGEAVLALDALSVERLKRLSEELSDSSHADVIMPILTSVGLAAEVSDALDNCSVELLKKCVALGSGTSRGLSVPDLACAPRE